jgi:hypothetical protein
MVKTCDLIERMIYGAPVPHLRAGEPQWHDAFCNQTREDRWLQTVGLLDFPSPNASGGLFGFLRHSF